MRFSSKISDQIDTDFRAEVVAAELINRGLPAEQIIILLLGSKKRSYRKDVDTVTEDISDYNNKEYTLVTTHKEGIYDMLPEGLFHAPTLPKTATTQKEIIDSIKKHRVEERNARRFFLPYEAGINHLRIQLAMYESRLDKGAHHSDLVNIFKPYWSIFKYLDTRQSNVFLQVLPLIHDIRDDYQVAATIFELIFAVPVNISCKPQGPLHAATPVYSCLNDTLLGINFTTSNAIYETGEEEIIITVGPIANEQLKQFMPGTTNSKIMELIGDFLLPAHLEISTHFELFDTDKKTRLADQENDFNSTLGVSTYL